MKKRSKSQKGKRHHAKYVFGCRANLKSVCFAVRTSVVDRDITGHMDIAKIEDWSRFVQPSTCQDLDLPDKQAKISNPRVWWKIREGPFI